MKYYLQLNDNFATEEAKQLIGDTNLTNIKNYLSNSTFDSQESYDKFVTGLMELVSQSNIGNSLTKKVFNFELKQIEKKTPLIEKTPWGLVSIQKVIVPENHIEKYLVVKKDGVLGFEFHERKHEKLDIKEGIAMIIYADRDASGYEEGQLMAHIGTAGSVYEFMPYDEHGMVALIDSVILETSTNDLDDLIFIFNTTQII
jgi:hypothetical protein